MNYEEQLEQMLQPIETELDKMNNITNECEKLKKQIKKVEATFFEQATAKLSQELTSLRFSLKELEQVQEEQQQKVMGLIKPILSQLKEVARMYVYDRSDTKGKRLAESEELLERIILKYHEEEQEYEQLAQTAEASDVIQRVKGVMNMIGEDIYFRYSTLYSPHNFSKPFIDKVELELDAIKNKDK